MLTVTSTYGGLLQQPESAQKMTGPLLAVTLTSRAVVGVFVLRVSTLLGSHDALFWLASQLASSRDQLFSADTDGAAIDY